MAYWNTFIWMSLSCLVCSHAFECQRGWFGPNCEYKCRCLSNNCSAVDGQCANGSKCQLGWFGPACQYADLAQSEKLATRGFPPLSVVTDGNEDTCLGAYTKDITVKWAVPYQITWMRIYVHDSYLVNRFSVKFKTDWNRQIFCKNPRTYKVSDKAFDIVCDLDVTVTQVTVSWEGRSYLCSLYISGGRNVALKQNTTQTSTDLRTFKTSASTNAVDGNTNIDYIYGMCAQTDNGDPSPKWNVIFSRNFTVNRYLLYHKIDARYFLRRTYWFTLQGLSMDGQVVFTDRGSGSTRQNVYRVTTATSTSPIAQVSVQSAGNSLRFTAAPSVLSLCEVGVYGDSICEHGQYGRDCEHTCNCADKNEDCFVGTGGCTSGCATGFVGEGCSQRCPPGTFGQNCSSSCSQLCLADSDEVNVCDHLTGTCLLGCQIGFEGPWCNTTCTPGTYGQGCNYECSELCESDASNNTPSCHHLHGVCLHGCRPGYKGQMCNEICTSGKFGQECNFTCPEFCLADNRNINICEHSSGRCLLGCQSGYDGPWCNQTCALGSYGLVCKSSCPEFCRVENTSTSSCHHIHGNCVLGCQPGYTGQMCNSPCDPGIYGPECGDVCSELCAADSVGVHACHHVSGVCLRGCQKGYEGPWCNYTCDNGTHGEECSSPCPQFCDDTNIEEPVCHHIHGTCLQGCQAGYKESTCNTTCDNGTFGQDCSFLCPQFCRMMNVTDAVCHYIDGTCLQGCQPGYTAPMCNEPCKPGTFGSRCSVPCSQFCDRSGCDPINGTCLFGCRSGYTGPLCNKQCPLGKFGSHCISDCSFRCLKLEGSTSACHPANGSCLFGCLEGYEGHNCSVAMKMDDADLETDKVWVVVAVFGVAILAAAAAVFWWRRKQIRSHMFNIAIHVKIKKSDSTDNIINTDLLDPDSSKFSF